MSAVVDAMGLYRRLRDHHGFTINVNTGAIPTSGYVVNTGDATTTVHDHDFFTGRGPAALRDLIDTDAPLVGGWWDRDSRTITLDHVDLMADRNAAITAGRERHQRYVWDATSAQPIAID